MTNGQQAAILQREETEHSAKQREPGYPIAKRDKEQDSKGRDEREEGADRTKMISRNRKVKKWEARNMTNYRCVEPFGIDNGELDGLRPQDCFVLGVEWQTVYAKILKAKGFACPIHAQNKLRIEQLLERHNRHYDWVLAHDENLHYEDWQGTWLELIVHARTDGQ